MRKSFGLAVVGLVTLAFGIASSHTSQARLNQPIPFTFEQILADHNLLRLAALPLKGFVVNDTIDLNQSLHFDSPVPLPPRNKDRVYAQTTQQDIPETEDTESFRRIMRYAMHEEPTASDSQKLHQRPMGEIVQAIAEQFLGKAYKANLLDRSQEETLVVTLNKFDCVLFVETVLAIARGVAVQDYSYPTFVERIRDQRYRHGQMNGYCSRLHYFSEWIFDNQKRGTVKNIAPDLGGVPLNKTLNFMSKHRQSYPSLISSDVNYQCIVEMEAKLDGSKVNYIPTNQIRRVYDRLQPGDIVAIATDIPGLDVTHTGLVYRHPDGAIGLIHASPIGKVTIARDLQTYVGRVENAIGILVARPINPRQTTDEAALSDYRN
jgi:hypothetical protein